MNNLFNFLEDLKLITLFPFKLVIYLFILVLILPLTMFVLFLVTDFKSYQDRKDSSQTISSMIKF